MRWPAQAHLRRWEFARAFLEGSCSALPSVYAHVLQSGILRKLRSLAIYLAPSKPSPPGQLTAAARGGLGYSFQSPHKPPSGRGLRAHPMAPCDS
eukprot:790218-Pelagomonas_calceolata.AAC.1